MNNHAVGTKADPGALSRVAEAPRSPGLMLAMATLGFAAELLGVGAAEPAGPAVREEGQAGRLSGVRRGAAGRGAGRGRLARPESSSARSPTGTAVG